MKLQINKDFRISTDKRNWILEKRSDSKNKETKEITDSWLAQGYYISLNSLVNAYPDVILKQSDCIGVTEALETVKVACKELTGALSPKYEVILK